MQKKAGVKKKVGGEKKECLEFTSTEINSWPGRTHKKMGSAKEGRRKKKHSLSCFRSCQAGIFVR